MFSMMLGLFCVSGDDDNDGNDDDDDGLTSGVLSLPLSFPVFF